MTSRSVSESGKSEYVRPSARLYYALNLKRTSLEVTQPRIILPYLITKKRPCIAELNRRKSNSSYQISSLS